MGTSRLYGYSARFGLNPREKRRKKNEKFGCFLGFRGFSGQVVWKTIRAGLPHLFAPIQSSGNQNLTKFVLIFVFVSLF